jgi:hypothetical protein
MLEPKHDILSRYLARRQITEKQYQAGRRWQALYVSAKAGDLDANKLLSNSCDGLSWIELPVVVGDRTLRIRGNDLLRDVLVGADDGGISGATKLAQVAAKYGLNPESGSRHMKALGKKLRHCLRLLVNVFRDADRDPNQSLPRWIDRTDPELRGVIVSTSDNTPIENIQSLARAKGFRIRERDYGLFELYTAENQRCAVRSAMVGELSTVVTLAEIKAALEATQSRAIAKPARRKLGPRVGRPITLAKRA